MSRILVTGNYDVAGNFVLSLGEDSRYGDGKKGDVFKTIAPETVIGVGNSIGGYFARRITYAGQKMLALVRVSGGEKRRSVEELRRITADRKGFVLKPMIGLWATSSGSALRGIFHRYTPPADPIEAALEKAGQGRKCLHRVPAIEGVEVREGGRICGHQTGNGSGSTAQYDGEVTETVIEPSCVESHYNQYHVGCGETAGTYRVTGGTFVLQWSTHQYMNGVWSRNLAAVYVTPQADPRLLAALIAAGPLGSVYLERRKLEEASVTAS